MVRFEAAQEKDVIEWFKRYRMELKTLNIRKRSNIINFDEGGFRIECLRSEEILVPADIYQLYSTSPDNRKSVSVIEMINAVSDFPPPPLVIIVGQHIMANWYRDELPEDTRILSSNAGFTSDEIAMIFLQHYIDNSNAGPDAD